MKFNFGLIYKRMLDFLRSSKILLLYFWGIKVEEKIHDYFWDVVTINLKNLIDKQHFQYSVSLRKRVLYIRRVSDQQKI